MRTIRDAAGTSWTVYEVKKQGGLPGDRWSYLPSEFGAGWLCFESPACKRRLAPIPARWRDASDADLERMLGQAQTVTRPSYSSEDRPNA
jgi:hypothetical protein